MREYELTGFVNFMPISRSLKTLDIGYTQVYLVAFDGKSENQSLKLVGNFCGDDITPKLQTSTRHKKIDQLIDEMINQDPTNKSFYFKDRDSFPVYSAVLLGWSKFSYSYQDRLDPWCCTFRELTNEGKKLYYSIKKLHNEQEVRLLTFNQIK
jgi:hypothetical protein